MLRVYKKGCGGFAPSDKALAWINKNSEGIWELLYKPSGCRTYTCCYWYYSQVDKEYSLSVLPLKESVPPPSKEYTGIFFNVSKDEGTLESTDTNVRNNIAILHKLEEENGLNKTEVLLVDDPEGFVGHIFIGDLAWRSCLWKISLYTFLLKRLTYMEFVPNDFEYDRDYYNALYRKDNIKKLLSKVKDFNEEILVCANYEGVHEKSGFYTICKGEDNIPMTKLLLGDTK